MASSLWDLFINYLMPILGTLISAGLVWLGKLLKDKFGLQIEAAQREALQTALTNAAGLVLAKIGTKVELTHITPSNPILQAAIDYVLKSAPEALDHFDLSPADIAEKIVAKLGLAK